MRLGLYASLAGALLLSMTAAVSAQDIDLGDIVAGGDGLGNANPDFPVDIIDYPAVGISQDFGLFEAERLYSNTGDFGFIEVVESPFIDGVVPFTAELEQINSDGVQWSMEGDDRTGNRWDIILSGREAGDSTDGPNPPDDPLGIQMAGATFERGIGMHASNGITFNLDELRAAHGDAAVQYFSGFGGDANMFCANQTAPDGEVNAYVILSDASGVTRTRASFFRFPWPVRST